MRSLKRRSALSSKCKKCSFCEKSKVVRCGWCKKSLFRRRLQIISFLLGLYRIEVAVEVIGLVAFCFVEKWLHIGIFILFLKLPAAFFLVVANFVLRPSRSLLYALSIGHRQIDDLIYRYGRITCKRESAFGMQRKQGAD